MPTNIKTKSNTPQISFSIFSILLIVLFGFISLRFENVLMIPTIELVKRHWHRHGRWQRRRLGIGAIPEDFFRQCGSLRVISLAKFLGRYQIVWACVQLLRLLTFLWISFRGLYHLGFGLWMGLDCWIYRITLWRVRFQRGLKVWIIWEPLTWVRTSSLGRFLMALEVLPSNHKN